MLQYRSLAPMQMPRLYTLVAMTAALVVRAAPLCAQSGDSHSGLRPLEMFAAFGADTSLGDPGVASDSIQPDDVHGVIVQYRNALRGWLSTVERARLGAIDASGTADVEAWRLRYLAADRALRHFAPMALDAVVRRRDAARLRSITPIIDERSALAAGRIAVVSGALRRRNRIETATADAFARSFLESPLETSMRADFDARSLAADRTVIAAANCASHADIGEAAQSARDAADAYGPAPEDRAVAIDAALELLRDMIALARGVEEVGSSAERHMPEGDPFEPVIEPTRPRRPHSSRRRSRAEPTTHASALPTFDTFMGLPP